MPSNDEVRVYCVVTCDLFHYGHVNFFRQARELGTKLIVGVCSDEDIAEYKRPPILTLKERAAVIEGCKYVDEVIPAAPPYVSYAWMKQHKLDIVMACERYSDEAIDTYYRDAKAAGKLQRVPYTQDISTTEILNRCIAAGKEVEEFKSTLETLNPDNTDRFSHERALISEEMYGEGFQSTSGTEITTSLAQKLNYKSGDRVLDFGCGTGGTPLLLAKKFGVHVTGLDNAPANIEICNERKQKSQLDVEFYCKDIRTDDLGSDFNSVWTRDVLLYVHDKIHALSKLRSAVKPGGKSLIMDFGLGNGSVSRKFHNHIYSAGYALLKNDEYIRLLEQCGFELAEHIDLSEFCLKSLKSDVERLAQKRDEVVDRYNEKTYDDLRDRWLKKIAFTENDELTNQCFIVTAS